MRFAPSKMRYTIAFLAIPAAVGVLRRRRRLAARDRQLERDRMFLRGIIDHAPIGVASLDTGLHFRWVNHAFARKRGWQPRQFVGRTFAEVFPEAVGLMGPALASALGHSDCVRFQQVPYRHSPDMPMQYWDTTAISMVDRQNDSGLLLITVNVTERVEQLQKLQEVDRLKDHFLSTISHELKTPLSLIRGYAELLEEKYPGETLLDGVLDGCRRLEEHLNAVIDYSALLSGSLPLYKTETCPAEVVENVRGLMEGELKRKHQHFHVDIVPGLPTIEVDVRRLTQVLVELIDNARKQTPPHGHLGLTVEPIDGEVRFTVWDTGPGIAPEKFAQIWEAFSQLDAEDAHRRGGLGLGLTIVKAITELHCGRPAVESVPGQGSRFSIALPVKHA